jgi:hypothetical protein
MGRLNLRAEAATCPRVASGVLDPAVEAEFLRMTKECEAAANLIYVRMLNQLSAQVRPVAAPN